MSSIKVIKRDGIVTEFDIERIITAIYKANLETKELDVSTIEEFKDNHIVKSIVADIIKYYSSSKEDIHVEKIQDLVEENLIRFNLNKTAKSYILYRDKRSKVREASSYIANTIAEFTYKDANENESARSNANINADTAAGTMLYYGSETSKWFTRTQLLKPHLAKLHDEGYFHIHDLDYFAIGNTNCLQIPLDKLLKNGFDTGHGYVRSPSNIKTAASLACIALQSNQAEQYGGQSLAAFDFALAPYVAKTFIKELCKVVELDIVGESSVEELKEELTELSNECSLLSNPNKVIELLNSYFYDWEDDEAILYEWSENTYQYKRLKKYFDKALERTDKETYQAMEALVHNFCTMHSRAGNQICFSSINFGMDTSEEGRMVSKNLMLAQEAGMGNGETAIFPITIMSLMEGYNFNPGDPNYDLFKLSCRVSAKRLYPNWQNNNAPYNKKYFKPGNPDTITSVMGVLSGDEFVVVYFEDTNTIRSVNIKNFVTRFDKNYNTIFSLHKYTLEEDWIEAPNVANTYYHNVSGIRIYDGKKFVKLKKVMYWKNPDSEWYKVTYIRNDTSSFAYNADLPEVKTAHELVMSHDHPLCVLDKTEESFENEFKRVLAKDIYNEKDKYSLVHSNCGTVSSYIAIDFDIEKLDTTLEYAYDFETESDKFAVGSRCTYDLTQYIVSHNCRTRVIGNTWNPDRETTSGRGNLSFVTINLPLLAIESHGDIDLFFNKLDTMMDNAQEVLMDRYKIQSNKKAKNFPFLVMQGLMMDGEKLDPEDKLGDTIRNGTLSIGFCGLSECLTALTGKHHGESEESQELGLRIIKYMRKRMDDEAERTKYNWSLFATPAESVAGRFCKCIKKKYGDLKGISDKDYLTNSSHVDVAYNCSMTHKVNVEAPYHELCNAGAIGYLEMESDPLQNLEAFENIVKYMCSKDMGYIAISHPVDRCPVCHYVGIIGDTCPQCGRTEDGWPSRAKLEELKLKNKLITIPDWLE